MNELWESYEGKGVTFADEYGQKLWINRGRVCR